MKISDFKRMSNSLSKTIHAFSLCFDVTEISDASLSYDGENYHLSFMCSFEYYNISFLSSSSEGSEANLVIESFFSNLISDIESNLAELEIQEKDDGNDWNELRMHNHEYGCLSEIASLEMLKGILSGLSK
ncbi:MAG: hypothetical protein V7744_14960 [Pseudomonadales bacterium]